MTPIAVRSTAHIQADHFLLNWPVEMQLQVTPEQFEALAQANHTLQLERTAKGVLIVNPSTGWETGERNFSLVGQLYLWRDRTDQLGKAFDSSTGFILPSGANRSPDLSWISQSRWDALTAAEKTTFPQICPDFVVELRSDSDNLAPLQAKLQEYIENGAALGWLIDPQNRQVEIYRVGQAPEILINPSELLGEQILPGFVLNLREIWDN
jgi:Uma2 family endonuclease